MFTTDNRDAGIVAFDAELDFEPRLLRPSFEHIDIIMTAQTAISHHDPAVQDDSNRNLFNRQRVLLAGAPPSALPDQEFVDRLCARHPVPESMVGMFEDVTFAEFVGASLIRLFLDTYNGRNHGNGEGVFTGRERYDRLEARVRHAAVGAPTLRAWWDRLCRGLNVGIHPSDVDVDLLELLTVPAGVQQITLRALTDGYRNVLALGRAWHTLRKAMSDAYAKSHGGQASGEALVPMPFAASRIARVGEAGASGVELPNVQPNTLRHCVRGPSWQHLVAMLGIEPKAPGRGTIPPGAEAIFTNGGNIAAGAKQPSDPHRLAQEIRARFPSLDLLGGVTDSFDLGESKLEVAGWLVCRENARALEGTPAEALPQASVSAFDMLDDVTQTRRSAAADGSGQMIFSFESLVQGVALLCQLTVRPWTSQLTRGALVAAIETFRQHPVVGGSAARGFARVSLDVHSHLREDAEEVRDAYERYLVLNRDALRADMASGTLGARTVVVS